MRLIRDLNPDPAQHAPTSVAVGNFDGLHRGHQALIRAALDGGRKLESAIMCFEPPPAVVFRPDRPQPRLLTIRDRFELCRDMGLDLMFMLRFNRAFARQSPERFVREVLVQGAKAQRVVVGHDFRFGARALGDLPMLHKLGRRYGFEVVCVDPICDGEQRISSTAVRHALGEGDLIMVERLLGRRYTISGRVLRGRAVGRGLGFPTANIRPPRPPALSGVLAVRVSGAGLDGHPGVASLGRRPTVDGRDWLLEVHLFDYDGALYGRHLTVEFTDYLRPEERFDNLQEMKEQMVVDGEVARRALGIDRSKR